MADKIIFRPVQGTEDQILAQPYSEGWIYFATDTDKIYLDVDGSKHLMGGGSSGSGIMYAGGSEEQIKKVSEDDSNYEYTIDIDALENSVVLPQEDALILNSDGRFFRVVSVDVDRNIINAILLAVSGTGGGGGVVTTSPLTIIPDTSTISGSYTYITGQHFNVNLTVNTQTVDDEGNLTFEFFRTSNLKEEPVAAIRKIIPLGEPVSIDLSEVNYVGTGMSIRITAESAMAEIPATRIFNNIRFIDMHIEKPIETNNADNYISAVTSAAELQLRYAPYALGLAGAKLHVSIDGTESTSLLKTLTSSDLNGTSAVVSIPEQSHGTHKINLWLSAEIGGMELNSTSIEYEAAWIRTGEEVPVIWTGKIPELVVQYENAVIPYMIYDPKAGATDSEIIFYRNGVKVGETEDRYHNDGWLYWDVTSLYQVGENRFSIVCGISTKEVIINVTTEGSRNLALKNQSSLALNLDASGRSSREVKTNRGIWESNIRGTTYSAELQNFNWYNNGWQDNQDGFGSFLSVANGASVSIPFKSMTLNQGQVGHTFEIRFRVRNAKKYGTLVTEIPKYYWYDADGRLNDGENGTKVLTLEQIAAAGGTLYLNEDGNPEMNEKDTTDKVVQTENNVAMKYLNTNNEGFCIGTQEAFFKTAGKTVNVRYKEGEIINISFVIDGVRKTLSIYLNGIISGAVNLNNIAAIDMVNIPFLINSEYCDFDLYKLRVYEVALTMPEVIHNYLSDLKNIALYDENQLTDKNDDTKLSYSTLVQYNEDHPDAPTMPYAVIDMTGLAPADRELPHFKGGNKMVSIEFTNPTADYLLDKGLITPYQYYTHCPSFKANNVDLNVQGTSSQIYPRRNFKTKFKSSKKTWVYTQGPLADKPIADGATLETGEKISKKWHMDSEKLGTNKFTWKIDYMESSGSYNTGLANLMGSGVYDKHPLEDLNIRDLDASIYRTSVYGFPMLVFHKTDENTYTYIGRYNLNLDKSANEYYGFEEEIEHPYVDKTWYEYEDDKVTIAETHEHPYIADVAECWELRDNQGTWCSFRYPDDMRAAGFGALTEDSTNEAPKLEVALHFEPRYHKEADQIEAARSYKTTDEDGKSLVPDYFATTSNQSICEYLRRKYANLEVVFNWLDSTDTTHATNTVFAEPVELLVGSTLTEDKQEEQGVTYEQRVVGDSTKTYGIFTKDSTEYRRQKFYAEFDDHFDKHYCTIYFIITELLLCYDSRGKNMMIASFGPRKRGGDYVWYPIFYDIDTQLGLNNVGAWLWDYNEDCTENRTFSTGTSVLWTNFYDLFYTEIISTYQALRRTKLTYQRIEGAYTCDPEVFTTSYAMRGKRPIVAIGLDEYYKYVLPTTENWKHQDGSYGTADYLYACQGDRILSRELLINNRLLYMDSKWMGGEFTIQTGGMSGIMFRVTANQQNATSDKYLDSDSLAPGQVKATYPVPYIDATPEFYVTPFLDFYVTTFVDEILYKTTESYDVAKYPNGIPTVVSPSILESFKSGSVDQQLNYFAGSPYISSLGDVSTKYPNQIKYENAEHLLDITLGSDVPEYFNNETLDPFELNTEKKTNGEDKKPLLQKIILSNLRSLDKKIDARGAGKLQEFRALGTKLPGVTFSDGAPLTTVHLPNTVDSLVFTENKNLTRILRTKPTVLDMVNGTAVFRDHSTYEGLYVEDLTDYNEINRGRGSLINTINFEGDALGYDSYEILHNLYELKYGSGRNNRLKVKMLNVHWTPYTQVEYGEEQLDNVTYYLLTDHSTYVTYTGISLIDWRNYTLNGRIYTYDPNTNESIIQDLSLLDEFIEDKLSVSGNDVNQFISDTEGTITASVPTITGELYVSNANGTAIDENLLTSKYGQYWNKLKITAANINEAYLAKYVQIDMNTGKEVEIETFRYNPAEITGQMVRDLPSKVISAPQTYDFRGWSYEPIDPHTKNVEDKLAYDIRANSWTDLGRSMAFSQDRTSITLYAVFTQTLYTVHFLNPDGTEIATTQTTYGQPIVDPKIVPMYDPGDLELEEVYSFKGYTREASNALPTNKNRLNSILVNLNTIMVTEDGINIYAVYMKQNVYDEPLSTDYFNFFPANYIESNLNETSMVADSAYNVMNGVRIEIKPGVHLQGKITLPTYSSDGKPVVTIGTTFATVSKDTNFEWPEGSIGGADITHIFWYKEPDQVTKPILVRTTQSYAFASDGGYQSHLKYFEFPSSFRYLGSSTFFRVDSLELLNLNDNIVAIGASAINGAFKPYITLPVFKIPGSVRYIGMYGISALNINIGTLQFGDEVSRSQLQYLNYKDFIYEDPDQAIFGSNSGIVQEIDFFASSTEQGNRFQALFDGANIAVSRLSFSGNLNINW